MYASSLWDSGRPQSSHLSFICSAIRASLLRLRLPSKLLCFANTSNSNTGGPLHGHIQNGPSMKIHEYQAKAILSRYGVTTPRGEVAFTNEEAREAAQRLKSNIVVVKAQIHAGGRGKAGGVKLARSADEAAHIPSHILRMPPLPPQTVPPPPTL